MTLQKVVRLCASFDSTAQGRLNTNAAHFLNILLAFILRGSFYECHRAVQLGKTDLMPQLYKSQLKGIVHQKSFIIKCDEESLFLLGFSRFVFQSQIFLFLFYHYYHDITASYILHFGLTAAHLKPRNKRKKKIPLKKYFICLLNSEKKT